MRPTSRPSPAARSTCSPSTPARCSTTTTRTPRSCSPTRSTPRSRRPCRRGSRCSTSPPPRTRTPSSSRRRPPSEWSLKAIPDLAAHQADLTIGAPPEFKTRQQGLVGLKSVYNITPKEFRPLQSQATVEALKNGQVKAANIFSTDPSIAANGFVVLEDPQSLFGSDNVVPLVRTEKADSIKAALNAVSAKLDTAALADMVKQVVVDKKDASEVAKTWLASAGLA